MGGGLARTRCGGGVVHGKLSLGLSVDALPWPGCGCTASFCNDEQVATLPRLPESPNKASLGGCFFVAGTTSSGRCGEAISNASRGDVKSRRLDKNISCTREHALGSRSRTGFAHRSHPRLRNVSLVVHMSLARRCALCPRGWAGYRFDCRQRRALVRGRNGLVAGGAAAAEGGTIALRCMGVKSHGSCRECKPHDERPSGDVVGDAGPNSGEMASRPGVG